MKPKYTGTEDVHIICSSCLHEAASNCGMIGGARCSLLERWESGQLPSEWSLQSPGWTCSAYEAGLLADELAMGERATLGARPLGRSRAMTRVRGH